MKNLLKMDIFQALEGLRSLLIMVNVILVIATTIAAVIYLKKYK